MTTGKLILELAQAIERLDDDQREQVGDRKFD